jgi:hypothetical protein
MATLVITMKDSIGKTLRVLRWIVPHGDVVISPGVNEDTVGFWPKI